MTFEELRCKEIISLKTGEKFGYADDLDLDSACACVCALIVRGRCKWFGLFGREDDIVIRWSDIEKIGCDTILVCSEGERRAQNRHSRKRDRTKFFS